MLICVRELQNNVFFFIFTIVLDLDKNVMTVSLETSLIIVSFCNI
jgi:hypothetical protein